mmetsp:Transcript_30895/g.46912  ORF Transcript_30895/g.46912 Transcript_30895/m.46912 type:complete len:191 (+) Transcript_30895:148-720(+)|eukprot:CAMPEP_0178922736 /NCGR_PEP_ID=MMETSP0786-20121207/16323_1 /TAXON_ID=186022 /ORGANISM="Thalassionema frauenfeldii, Strain CCMP 1798" /LENGTH=190 /DNA_ID=CAMNT_0020597141 /DNA_START=132 /DNA_END=704 /DNA_ORIENTATION=+
MGCTMLDNSPKKALSVVKKDRLHHSRAVSVDSFFFDLTSVTSKPKTPTDVLDPIVANAWLTNTNPVVTAAPKATLLKKKKRKMVAFGTVQIREHSIVMGASSSSFEYNKDDKVLPLQLGWDYNQHSKMSLNLFEKKKSKSRSHEELMLTPKQRLIKLSQVGGYTDRQLMKAQRTFLMQERDHFFTAQHMG